MLHISQTFAVVAQQRSRYTVKLEAEALIYGHGVHILMGAKCNARVLRFRCLLKNLRWSK